MDRNIIDLDATEIAALIRTGEITSLQATTAFIEHLHKIQPKINCMTVDRFDAARQEAIQADLKIQEGKILGKLHGVPISIKECFDVAGMATTGGLKHRTEMIEHEDAAIVAKLKQEGAIILTKTNVPTLCFCQETINKLYGRTNNPWDINRSAGGSSGGEGALIAAGGAAVGIGADIGGSIRFPSHYNGVVGFKSGNNKVDATGHFPPIHIPEQLRMLGIGALSKSVRDARFIHEIISDYERKFVDLDAYEIVMPKPIDGIPLDMDTKLQLTQVQQKIGEDYKLSTDSLPLFDEVALIWQELMSVEGAKHMKEYLSEDGKKSPIMEYVKEKVIGKSDFHSYITWALIGANLFKPSEARLTEIRDFLSAGDKELAQYFKHRIAIIPVYHTTAQKHGQQFSEIFSIKKTYQQYMPYIAYANVWGLPSLTIPVGVSEAGMPIGVQLISANGNEDAIFQFGEWMEAEIYEYQRCKQYDELYQLV